MEENSSTEEFIALIMDNSTEEMFNGSSMDYAVEDYPNAFDNIYVKCIFIVLYAVVFLLAFVGNILVITVVLKHRRMRTITNFFLANLAVADLAVGIFCVLPNLSLNLSPKWILGRVMCKLYYFVQAMSYTASITILTVISIERYVAIIYPLRAKQLTTMCLLRATVLLIWIISATSGIPYLIVYDQATTPAAPGFPVMHFCLPMHDINMEAFLTTNFVLWYCVPLFLMTIMYTKISIVLWRTSSQAVQAQKAALHKPSSSASSGDYSASRVQCRLIVSKANGVSNHDEHEKLMTPRIQRPLCSSNDESCVEGASYEVEDDRLPSTKKKFRTVDNAAKISRVNGVCDRQNKATAYRAKSRLAVHKERKQESALLARRRVIRLLIAVIVSFTLCVLPYHLRMLWQTWSEPSLSSLQQLLQPLSFVIFYLNCGLNPLLYAFLSERFRASLFEILTCKDYRRQRQTSFSLKTMNSTV